MINESKTAEIDLIRRIKSGDRAAEQELFANYQVFERVELMIRTRVRAPYEDQNDLINEVILSILTNLRRGMFNPEKGVLGSYLWGIARNKIRDYFKPDVLRGKALTIENDLFDCRETALERREKSRILLSILKGLENKYQEIILLRYYEDLSIEDISEQLSIKPTQVYNRIHYALSLIRNEWQKI